MNNYSNIWTHSHCLSKNQLLDYLQNKLDRDEVYLVESHLSDCQLCSDALDGYMENEIENPQTVINEIKKGVEEKIKELYPEPIKLTSSKPSISKNTNLKPNFFTKYRWPVAASILLFVGLGGYTVLSYIKSHDEPLAKNESETQPKANAEYKVSTDRSPNEISTLQIQPSKDSFKKSRSSSPSIGHQSFTPSQQTSEVYEEPAPVNQASAPENEIATADSPPLREMNEEKYQKESLQAKQSPNNYKEDIKQTTASEKYITKKSSAGGLSNSKPATNMNNTQLSYPAQQNVNAAQNYSQKDYAVEEIASKDEAEASDYEKGLSAYQNGNYRKSIRILERALKNSQGAQKEDIEYYLALSYQASGKEDKAQKLFESLALNSKYKTEAKAQLMRVKK